MMTKEERAVYDKTRYNKNKSSILIRNKKYRDDNKEKIHRYQKIYYNKKKGIMTKEISCEFMEHDSELIKETMEKALVFAKLWPASNKSAK